MIDVWLVVLMKGSDPNAVTIGEKRHRLLLDGDIAHKVALNKALVALIGLSLGWGLLGRSSGL